jgi:hypothetical protein
MIPVDPCDPTINFCCYLRGGGSKSCFPPTNIVFGAGCEFDEDCGDDGNGTRVGVGYFVFVHHYCWYDYAADDWSCYAKDGAPPGGPKDLYENWTRDATGVELVCKPSGYPGRGFAYYYDPKTVGVANFGFQPQGYKTIDYPGNFPGFGGKPSVKPATIESDWYLFGIPTPFSKVGICNGAD